MSWQTNNYRGGYNTSRAAYAPGSTDISTKGELIAKVYGILRDGMGLSAADCAAVFERWNDGVLQSYLIEISGKVAAAMLTGKDAGIDIAPLRLMRFFDGSPIELLSAI